MRDQRTYQRCACPGCPYLLPLPLTHCREHAADAVATDLLDVRGLTVD